MHIRSVCYGVFVFAEVRLNFITVLTVDTFNIFMTTNTIYKIQSMQNMLHTQHKTGGKNRNFWGRLATT
jgi:hypothetical protein